MKRVLRKGVKLHNKVDLNIELLIEEYTPYIFKIVDSISNDSLSYQDKEEIISDTFYLLWKNQTKIKTNIKSYLAKIAKNCTYHRLNQAKLTFELNENLDSEFTEDYDTNLLIKEKLKSLNIEERNIFNLYYINGYKIKEIAKLEKKSISNIKVTLYRVRKKLKED